MWCCFVSVGLDLKIYMLGKHSVLDMGQVLVLKLISPEYIHIYVYDKNRSFMPIALIGHIFLNLYFNPIPAGGGAI